MSDSHLSRPLCELAEELAGLISQLCELMIRKWTQSELKKGTPMVEFYRAISPDRLSRLEMPSLRLVAWAEQHKPAKERRQFQERYTSFCKLTMHFGTLVNPSTYLFSGLHVSPPQTSVVLLDDRHLMQAKLAGSHLPETLRAWALEMRQQAAKAQEPTEEAAGDPVAPACSPRNCRPARRPSQRTVATTAVLTARRKMNTTAAVLAARRKMNTTTVLRGGWENAST